MDIESIILGIAGGGISTAIVNHYLNKKERSDKITDNIIGRLTKDNERMSGEIEKLDKENSDCQAIKETSTKIIKQFEVEVQKLKNKLIQANLYNDDKPDPNNY
jgi:SMC interacting uncharacterized protein involved in chromosome segregation